MECFFTPFCWTAFPHTSLNHGLAPPVVRQQWRSWWKLRGGYNVPRPKVQIDADQQLCNAKSLLWHFFRWLVSTFWSFGTHFLQRPTVRGKEWPGLLLAFSCCINEVNISSYCALQWFCLCTLLTFTANGQLHTVPIATKLYPCEAGIYHCNSQCLERG